MEIDAIHFILICVEEYENIQRVRSFSKDKSLVNTSRDLSPITGTSKPAFPQSDQKKVGSSNHYATNTNQRSSSSSHRNTRLGYSSNNNETHQFSRIKPNRDRSRYFS